MPVPRVTTGPRRTGRMLGNARLLASGAQSGARRPGLQLHVCRWPAGSPGAPGGTPRCPAGAKPCVSRLGSPMRCPCEGVFPSPAQCAGSPASSDPAWPGRGTWCSSDTRAAPWSQHLRGEYVAHSGELWLRKASQWLRFCVLFGIQFPLILRQGFLFIFLFIFNMFNFNSIGQHKVRY